MGKDKIEVEVNYWDSGALMYKRKYLNGKPYGEQIGYWENGQLEYKHKYLNGKIHGEQLYYYEDGDLTNRFYYINGKEVSQKEWIKYSRNEKLQRILNKIKNFNLS